jgi:hypothetical protein
MSLPTSIRPRLWRKLAFFAALAAAFIFTLQSSMSSSPALSATHDTAYRISLNEFSEGVVVNRTMQAQGATRHAQAQKAASFAAAVKVAQWSDFLAAEHAAQVAQYVAALQQQHASVAAPATSAPVAAPAVGDPSGDTVTAEQRAAWDRVNMCEEGGAWNVDGPVYSGGLGFTHANWTQFNTFGFPSDAADATPEQQIQVATAFAAYYYGSADAAPDQDGCGSGY